MTGCVVMLDACCRNVLSNETKKQANAKKRSLGVICSFCHKNYVRDLAKGGRSLFQ